MKIELDFENKLATVKEVPEEGVFYLEMAKHLKDLLGEERMEWKIKFEQVYTSGYMTPGYISSGTTDIAGLTFSASTTGGSTADINSENRGSDEQERLRF